MRHAVVIAAVVMLASAGPLPAQEAPDAVIVGGRAAYVVRDGDALVSIAARFGVTTASIVELNQLARPNAIKPGQELIVDNPHLAIPDRSVSITINVAQRMLFFVESGRVSGYPITVGKAGWPTPLGPFTIIEKETNPSWDVPVSIQREMAREGKPVITCMAPGPENPLGAFYLRLSIPNVGIHGTNAPSSIYRYGSHGCIRMHPDAIAELFGRVGVGTSGVLVYQPILCAVVDGTIWLEANPDPYKRGPAAMPFVRDAAGRAGVSERVDWDKVSAALRQRAGRAIDITRRD